MKADADHFEFVRLRAASGFWTGEEMADLVADMVAEELEDDDESAVALMHAAAEELAKLGAAEATWTSATVNDRIGAAFEALEQEGIIALQNAGYTTSDGWDDVNAIAKELDEAGNRPRGATFYHGQALEHGVEGRGLTLAFGAFVKGDGYADAVRAVARDVVAMLERFGVAVSWSGAIDAKIEIVPFEWKQRLHTTAPIVVPLLDEPRPPMDLLN